MNRMKPAFLISMFGAQALQSRQNSAAADWRSALRSPPPFIVNGPACNSRTPMNSRARIATRIAAAARSDVNGLKRLPSDSFCRKNSPFPYAHRMTGVRLNPNLRGRDLLASLLRAQIPAIAWSRAERVNSTLCCPPDQSEAGGERQKAGVGAIPGAALDPPRSPGRVRAYLFKYSIACSSAAGGTRKRPVYGKPNSKIMKIAKAIDRP